MVVHRSTKQTESLIQVQDARIAELGAEIERLEAQAAIDKQWIKGMNRELARRDTEIERLQTVIAGLEKALGRDSRA